MNTTTTNQKNNDDEFYKNMFTNNMIIGKKTITINEDTHRELVKVGAYGESMDDIIKRLLDFYEKHRK
jgi:hypothetical protein